MILTIPSGPHACIAHRQIGAVNARKRCIRHLTTADRRSALCLRPLLELVLSTSTRHNSSYTSHTDWPYVKFNMFSLQKWRYHQWKFLIYYENGRYLKRGSLSNVNSGRLWRGHGATQYARQRSFPVIAFDLVTVVSLRDLQPLLSKDTSLPVCLTYRQGIPQTSITKISYVVVLAWNLFHQLVNQLVEFYAVIPLIFVVGIYL